MSKRSYISKPSFEVFMLGRCCRFLFIHLSLFLDLSNISPTLSSTLYNIPTHVHHYNVERVLLQTQCNKLTYKHLQDNRKLNSGKTIYTLHHTRTLTHRQTACLSLDITQKHAMLHFHYSANNVLCI